MNDSNIEGDGDKKERELSVRCIRARRIVDDRAVGVIERARMHFTPSPILRRPLSRGDNAPLISFFLELS